MIRRERCTCFGTFLVIAWMLGAAVGYSQVPPGGTAAPSVRTLQGNSPGSTNSATGGTGGTGAVESQSGAASASTVVPADAAPGMLTPQQSESLAATIQQRLETVQADEQMAADIKDALIKLYQKALADLQRAATLIESAGAFRQRVAAAPQLYEAAKQEKEQQARSGTTSDVDLTEFSYEELIARKQRVESDLAAATARESQLSAESNKRAARRKELPQLISNLKSQIDQAVAASAQTGPAPTDNGTDALMLEAQRWANTAKLHAMAAELASLEAELRAYDAESQLLPLQIELAQAAKNRLQQQLKAIEEELAERRKNRILSYRIDFGQLELPAVPAFQRIRQWLGLESASRELTVPKGLTSQLTWPEIAQQYQQAQQQLASYRAELDAWRARREKMQLRVEGRDEAAGGFNIWVGLMLRKQRAELPSETELVSQLRATQQRIDEADSLMFDIEDTLNQLRQLRSDTSQTIDDNLAIALSMAEEILTAMREDAEAYLDDLYELADVLDQTIEFTREYRKFIDEHVLWIRSSDPLSALHIKPATEALMWLVDGDNWRAAARLLGQDLRNAWGWYALILLVFVLLVGYGTRLRRRLSELSQKAARGSCTQYSLTAESALITLLLALPIPLLLWGIAWRFRAGTSFAPSDAAGVQFLHAWGAGLKIAAYVVMPLELLRQTVRSNGLGIKHFRWNEEIGIRLKTSLRWLIDLSLPLVVLIGVVGASGSSMWDESLGRVCFVLLMVILSLFLARIFHPANGLLSTRLRAHPDGWLNRLRYLWYSTIIVCPLMIATASVVGYHYTAQRIARHLNATVWMIVALLIIYSLLERWVLLGRRRLMIAQARKRLEEATQREAAQPAAGGSSQPEPQQEAEEIDLAAVGEQTRRLILSLTLAVGLVGGYYIWSDVLPAINLLNRFELWRVQGATPDETVAITLAHLILVVPIIVLVVIAARNVPGLLEMFLQQLPITAASKYAMITLIRYIIVGIGIAIVASTIGLRWSSVQWLVAALGVGIGFGLQEIVANFVSGLILLFEQPIRVGDIVTLDGTTGKVGKIRIRATTIVNWDRQELIVPNKNLITGKLINWTLTDQTNRIVINVGVEYGSDPVRACEVIARVCEENEFLLKDPAPMVTFEGFGDSALNIVVRAYLPDLVNRLDVIHALHTAIYKALNEEGIGIPFPQRDLHLRTIPPEVLQALVAERGEKP